MEILPNWHPLFVHFTIALLIVSALLYLAALLARLLGKNYEAAHQTAIWCLWIGAGFTIATVLAGLQAFGSVNHDGPSHLSMLSHRQWAFITVGVLVVTLGISFFLRANRVPSVLFSIVLLCLSVVVSITGFKGGELVFRHGLGVQSMPKMGAHDHATHDRKALAPEVTSESAADKHAHEDGAEHGHRDEDDHGQDEEKDGDDGDANHVHEDGAVHKH